MATPNAALPRAASRWLRGLMAAAGAVLLLDALALLLARVLHFGVYLPLLMGGALLALAWHWPRWQEWLSLSAWRRWVWRAACCGALLWLASLAVFFAQIGSDHDVDPRKLGGGAAIRSVVVLGSGTPDCQVSPTLEQRVALAERVAGQAPQALLVLSGGKDRWRTCTESEIMHGWLLAHGLPAARMVQENRSTSTAENLRFSRAVLAAQGIDAQQPMLIVTSDFHQLRARRIAARQGFAQVASVGAPTPLYVRYNAWLREYFAFISGWLLGES